jgi:hypothetical protein
LSDLAPRVIQPVVNGKRTTITISGGGDPLFSGVERDVPEHTLYLIRASVSQGYKVRIITREVNIAKKLILEYLIRENISDKVRFSFSLDGNTMHGLVSLASTQPELFKYIEEVTIVPGVVPDFNWITTYLKSFDELLAKYGIKDLPLTVRENLRSVRTLQKRVICEEAIPMMNASFACLKVRWLPKYICLERNLYLIQKMPIFDNKEILDGLDMTLNFEQLADFFRNDEGCVLYGGAARAWMLSVLNEEHTIKNTAIAEYNDFDVFVLKSELKRVLRYLERTFLLHIETSLCKMEKRLVLKRKIDPSFKVVLYIVPDLDVAWTILSEAEIGFNRFGLSNGRIKVFDGYYQDDLINGIARKLPHKWKYLKPKYRSLSEAKHVHKLQMKGCEIVEMNIFQRIKQFYFNLTHRNTNYGD